MIIRQCPAVPSRSSQRGTLALVPGNAWGSKALWEAVARTLPQRTVLLILPAQVTPQRHVLEQVAKLLSQEGYQVVMITEDQLTTAHPTSLQLTLLG